MAERRIIGSDTGSTRSILGQARQEAQTTYGVLSQAMSQQAEISKSITSDALAANQAQAEAARTTFQAAAIKGEQVQREIASVAQTLGNMIGVEQERAKKALELEYKRQEEELKKRQGLARVGATTEVEELINNARNVVYNDPAGGSKYKASVLQTLDKYGDLEPDIRAALTQKAYGTLNDIEKEQFQKQQSFFDEVNKAQRETKIQYFKLQTASVISGIENAAITGSDLQPFLGKFNELLGAALGDSNLDALGQLQLASSALETLANSSNVYEDKRNEILATLKGIQEVYKKANEVYQSTGGDVNLTRMAAIGEAAKYGIDPSTAGSFTNPLANIGAVEEYERLTRNIEEMRSNRVVTAAQQLDFNQKATAYLALSLYGNVGALEALKKDPVKSRILAPVFPVVEAIERYNKDKNTLYADILKTQEEVNKWRLQGTQYLNNELAEGTYKQNLLNYWASQYNLPTPPPDLSSTTDSEQKAKLLEQWREYHQIVDKSLTDQLANKTRQLEELAQPLRTMGLIDDNGKFIDPNLYKSDYENWKTQVDKLQAANQNQTSPGIGGRPPNFNQGSANVPFVRVKGSLGQTIPIPFKAGTKGLVVGHSYGQAGDRRHGRDRPHAGLDIAAPMGTPVTAMVSGEVVNTDKQLPNPNGYGLYVDIKDDATGRIHRFSHLQSYSVKKGDRINIGQDFGKVGSTGRSTGAHLHWEIRSQVGGYFDGSLDVEKEALNLTDGQGIRKVRQDNAEWYANAPDPYGTALQQIDDVIKSKTIPGNAIPLNGGSYIVNNKVANINNSQQIMQDLDAMVTSSNPLRISASTPTSPKMNNKNENGQYRTDTYGYAPLARKSVEFRRKLHEVSDRLGIEAVWLIDLIGSVENTNFDPQVRNQYGCTGLIQWCPRSSTDRRSWNENGVTVDQLHKMTDVQQAEQIYEYLKGVKGRIKSAAHLAGYVLFGEQGLREVEKGNLASYQRKDGNGTSLKEYVRRMGRFGRNYLTAQEDRRNRAGAVIHNSFNQGCTMCNSLAMSNSMIVPHEAQGDNLA